MTIGLTGGATRSGSDNTPANNLTNDDRGPVAQLIDRDNVDVYLSFTAYVECIHSWARMRHHQRDECARKRTSAFGASHGQDESAT